MQQKYEHWKLHKLFFFILCIFIIKIPFFFCSPRLEFYSCERISDEVLSQLFEQNACITIIPW